jgi:micrococcal nuclease
MRLFFKLLTVLLFVIPLWGVSLHLKPNSIYICYVAKVLDGDTIRCRFPAGVVEGVETYPVRLIGIDTPETGIHKKNTGKQAKEIEKIAEKAYDEDIEVSKREVVKLGLEAKKFVENLLRNVYVVIIETDVKPLDHYGRVLGYVWLPDGRMLNREIICNGYALPLTIPPNVKYQREFLNCFRKALKEKRGLWGKVSD